MENPFRSFLVHVAMQPSPFPSLLLHDNDDGGGGGGEEDSLLQLSGQEEAMLSEAGQRGEELELLEPPPNSPPAEESTLINPGDWNQDSNSPGTRGSAINLDVEGAFLCVFSSLPSTI